MRHFPVLTTCRCCKSSWSLYIIALTVRAVLHFWLGVPWHWWGLPDCRKARWHHQNQRRVDPSPRNWKFNCCRCTCIYMYYSVLTYTYFTLSFFISLLWIGIKILNAYTITKWRKFIYYGNTVHRSTSIESSGLTCTSSSSILGQVYLFPSFRSTY